jgi:hypothetical protein
MMWGRMVSFLGSSFFFFLKASIFHSVSSNWQSQASCCQLLSSLGDSSSVGNKRKVELNWQQFWLANWYSIALGTTCWGRWNSSTQWLVLRLCRCDRHLLCSFQGNKTVLLEHCIAPHVILVVLVDMSFPLSLAHRDDHMNEAWTVRSLRIFFFWWWNKADVSPEAVNDKG